MGSKCFTCVILFLADPPSTRPHCIHTPWSVHCLTSCCSWEQTPWTANAASRYSSLQFPYAQFPCTSVRGDQLFTLFWDAVARLERYGVKVLGLTCDGLSVNCRLLRIHNSSGNAEFIYKIPNPYSSEPRYILHFHCLFLLGSKNRQLWVSCSDYM